MRVKTGKYYWTRRKFWGGFDLWLEEKITNDKFYPEYEYYKYRKGNLSDLGELGIMHDNMSSKFK